MEAALAHKKTFPSRSDEYGIGFREDLEYDQNVSDIEYARVTKCVQSSAGDCTICLIVLTVWSVQQCQIPQ